MAAPPTPCATRPPRRAGRLMRRGVWFVALWLAGIAATAGLYYALRALLWLQ